jgi:acyl carrier protein
MSGVSVDDVRPIVVEHGRIPADPGSLGPDSSLYDAGMSSHASVNVMLALEDAFDVEFPDRMLTRDVFETLGAIATAVSTLREEEAAV